MTKTKVLPLIPQKDRRKEYQKLIKKHNLQFKGWILLVLTWIIFIVSMLLLLEVYTIPNPTGSDFPVENYYTYAIWLVPCGLWIWCWISFTGTKLFKHSKGTGKKV